MVSKVKKSAGLQYITQVAFQKYVQTVQHLYHFSVNQYATLSIDINYIYFDFSTILWLASVFSICKGLRIL